MNKYINIVIKALLVLLIVAALSSAVGVALYVLGLETDFVRSLEIGYLIECTIGTFLYLYKNMKFSY